MARPGRCRAGKLVAQRFSTPGRHQHKGITTSDQPLDDFPLIGRNSCRPKTWRKVSSIESMDGFCAESGTGWVVANVHHSGSFGKGHPGYKRLNHSLMCRGKGSSSGVLNRSLVGNELPLLVAPRLKYVVESRIGTDRSRALSHGTHSGKRRIQARHPEAARLLSRKRLSSTPCPGTGAWP